jgi:hypothetical protein
LLSKIFLVLPIKADFLFVEPKAKSELFFFIVE